MIHIRNREELIDYVEKHCKRKAIVRAVQEGSIECLGAFSKLGPYDKPGWILRLISQPSGNVHIVEVVEDPEKRRYGIYVNRTIVPWKCWVGSPTGNVFGSGDNPKRYRRLRENA